MDSFTAPLSGVLNLTSAVARSYPLVNHTAVIHLTPGDFVKPGDYGTVISTLPMFQVLLNGAAFIVWLVVLLYFWKFIYYEVSDEYATPGGSAPPHFKRSEDSTDHLWNDVYKAIHEHF